MSPAPASGAKSLTCGFCDRRFREDRGQPACVGCPLTDACHFVRCPHCGYENPASPGLPGRGILERIRDWRKSRVSA